jgi:hypothetical protein
MGFLLKIAVFAVAAYTVWSAVTRWYGLLGGGGPKARPAPPPQQSPQQPPSQPRAPIEDTRQCPVCAAYVSLAATKCGRPGCPLAA